MRLKILPRHIWFPLRKQIVLSNKKFVENIINKTYKIRGSAQIGLFSSSWPFGELEIDSDHIFIRDKLLGTEYRLSKTDIVQIEINKVISIIACYLKISHKNKEYDWETVYFWSYSYNKLLNALKEFGWLK